MPLPQPIHVKHLFPPVLESLLALLDGLRLEQWQAGTGGAWTVKDTAAHLLGGDLGILSRKRDSYTPPGGAPSSWEELVGFINDLNAVWVGASRRLSPAVLCDLLRHTGPQVTAYFQSLDENAVGGPVDWAGPGAAPVWLDLAREYTERWHHQQQIRDAVGRPGFTEPEYFAPVLDAFVRALPHTYRAVAAPEGTLVALTISGPAGGQWSIIREPNGWQLRTGLSGAPQAHVVIDEQTAWRLFTRGVSPAEAERSVQIEGDQAFGRPALGMVSVLA